MENIRKETMAYLEIRIDDFRGAIKVLENKLGIRNYEVVNEHCIRVFEQNISQSQINKELILSGIVVNGLEKQQQHLEEYFLQLINGGHPHA
ncbi:hypothetical protein D3C79_1044340 [compost metagenome]